MCMSDTKKYVTAQKTGVIKFTPAFVILSLICPTFHLTIQISCNTSSAFLWTDDPSGSCHCLDNAVHICHSSDSQLFF